MSLQTMREALSDIKDDRDAYMRIKAHLASIGRAGDYITLCSGVDVPAIDLKLLVSGAFLLDDDVQRYIEARFLDADIDATTKSICDSLGVDYSRVVKAMSTVAFENYSDSLSSARLNEEWRKLQLVIIRALRRAIQDDVGRAMAIIERLTSNPSSYRILLNGLPENGSLSDENDGGLNVINAEYSVLSCEAETEA